MEYADFWCVDKNSRNLSYFNNVCIVLVRNGRGFLGLGTLKSALSQEPVDEIS